MRDREREKILNENGKINNQQDLYLRKTSQIFLIGFFKKWNLFSYTFLNCFFLKNNNFFSCKLMITVHF